MPGALDWSTCENPTDLIGYARKYPGPHLDRALRFFALHCCRLIAPAINDPRSRTVLELAERRLIGLASGGDVATAALDAYAAAIAARGEWERYAHDPATSADHAGRAERMSNSLGAHVAATAAHIGYYDGMLAHLRDALAFRHHTLGLHSSSVFRGQLCATLREVVENPFRRIEVEPEWRTETVVLMAGEMTSANDFAAAPILADALQDAGCDTDDLLTHLRDPHATHRRGCWAVELLRAPA